MKFPEWITLKAIAWSLYDFADTAFSALFITFFFPLLIKVHLGGNEFQIGLAMSLSLFLAALVVPFVGALADATGRKIPILVATTIIATLFMAVTGYMNLYAALIAGFAANFFNLLDVDVYDSQLTDIADAREWGRVSGFGTAVGYLGTFPSLLMGYLIMAGIGWETKMGVQLIFPATAAFFFIFSLPLFFFLKDVPKPKIPFKESVGRAVRALHYTFTRMREIKGLGSFLLSSFAYTNAINAVIVFLALYATQVIHLSVREFFFVFAAFAAGAFGGSFGFGHISDTLGPKRSLVIALVTWIAVIIYFLYVAQVAAFIDTPIMHRLIIAPANGFFGVLGIPPFLNPLVIAFTLGGIVGGAVLGPIWLLNRHLIAKLSPPHKMAELFGMKGLAEDISGVLGPLLFGAIVTLAGAGNEAVGYRNALLFIMGLFIAGLLILWRMPREVKV